MKHLNNYTIEKNTKKYFDKYILIDSHISLSILEYVENVEYNLDYLIFKKIYVMYSENEEPKMLPKQKNELTLRAKFVKKLLVAQSDNLNELLERMKTYYSIKKYNI